MRCPSCGAELEPGFATSVTELGESVVIIRHVPCVKCVECEKTIYTARTVQKLEEIVEKAKQLVQGIAVIEYEKTA